MKLRKIATGQGDDYTTGCLFDYSYFIDYYKIIALDLSKQQVPDADPRAIAILQINFTANLDRVGNTKIFFIIEEATETVFDFPQGTTKVLYVQLNAISLSDLIFINIKWHNTRV